MRKIIMKKISLLIVLCCVSFLFISCGQGPKVAKVGESAPDFTLVDLQGKTWTLSELKGQVVFINFWATWCPPCLQEMPSMQRLYTMLPKDKFKMLAILNRDDPAIAKTIAAQFHITMPILNDQNNQVGSEYGLTGLPETFIVDKQGVLREKFIGPVQWDSPAYRQMLMSYINQ